MRAYTFTQSPVVPFRKPQSSSRSLFALWDVVEEYLVALRVAGRSPRTIDWYRANLVEFMRFLERDGRTVTVADLQPAPVRRWLLALNARPTALAPASLAGRVRTIKAFGTWTAGELDLPANPVRAVPIPRVPDQLVPSLRDHEIARLVQAAMESRHPQRDTALILLMIDRGMRLSEVASLRVADVDLIEGRCRVMGNGSLGAPRADRTGNSQGPARVGVRHDGSVAHRADEEQASEQVVGDGLDDLVRHARSAEAAERGRLCQALRGEPVAEHPERADIAGDADGGERRPPARRAMYAAPPGRDRRPGRPFLAAKDAEGASPAEDRVVRDDHRPARPSARPA